MYKAYIFLKLDSTDPEIGEKLLEKLRKRKEVKEAYMVYGIYDLIAKIEVETPERFRDTLKKIRNYNEVNRNFLLNLIIRD